MVPLKTSCYLTLKSELESESGTRKALSKDFPLALYNWSDTGDLPKIIDWLLEVQALPFFTFVYKVVT